MTGSLSSILQVSAVADHLVLGTRNITGQVESNRSYCSHGVRFFFLTSGSSDGVMSGNQQSCGQEFCKCSGTDHSGRRLRRWPRRSWFCKICRQFVENNDWYRSRILRTQWERDGSAVVVARLLLRLATAPQQHACMHACLLFCAWSYSRYPISATFTVPIPIPAVWS